MITTSDRQFDLERAMESIDNYNPRNDYDWLIDSLIDQCGQELLDKEHPAYQTASMTFTYHPVNGMVQLESIPFETIGTTVVHLGANEAIRSDMYHYTKYRLTGQGSKVRTHRFRVINTIYKVMKDNMMPKLKHYAECIAQGTIRPYHQGIMDMDVYFGDFSKETVLNYIVDHCFDSLSDFSFVMQYPRREQACERMSQYIVDSIYEEPTDHYLFQIIDPSLLYSIFESGYREDMDREQLIQNSQRVLKNNSDFEDRDIREDIEVIVENLSS